MCLQRAYAIFGFRVGAWLLSGGAVLAVLMGAVFGLLVGKLIR